MSAVAALMRIQEESFAAADRALRSSWSPERAMAAAELESFLDERTFCVLATTSAKGRPQARPVAFALAVGAFTRLAAVLLALYTLATALIAHRYWTVKGANKVDSLESFYKNLSIMGGFLLLCITGAGKYSIDAMVGS